MLPRHASTAELERAYEVIARLEQEVVEASRDQRLLFFSEVQGEIADRNIPTFPKGATMSQAFRMGMDAGVECTMAAIDKRDITMLQGETWLNVDFARESPDIMSMSDLWASYINT